MATQKETVEFILEKLGNSKHFSTRAMFGEYALYADNRVVALICNEQLYVKVLPASVELEDMCEKDTPYSGAKLHYVVEESQLDKIENLPEILLDISKSLSVKKEK